MKKHLTFRNIFTLATLLLMFGGLYLWLFGDLSRKPIVLEADFDQPEG